MRTLHIYCDGGFGNRLNGLVSGLLFAGIAGLKPVAVWPCNNWCGARFGEIFENSDLQVIERELATYVPEKGNFHFFMTEDHLGMGVPNLSPLAAGALPEVIRYLQSDSRDVFYHSPLIPSYMEASWVSAQIRLLKIRGEIQGHAAQFMERAGLKDEFYGLQIRKTDFGVGGADDSALFELVQKAADKRFFVCSDSKEVEARFQKLPNVAVYGKQAYVEKLVAGDWTTLAADHSGRVYPCNVNRSAQSVIDALVDLLVLSHSKVVKTSNSTFLNSALLLKAARNFNPSTPPVFPRPAITVNSGKILQPASGSEASPAQYPDTQPAPALNRYSLFAAGIFVDPMVSADRLKALAQSLKPVRTNFELIRVGGPNDGGYLVPNDLVGIRECFSPGVDTYASFEEHLLIHHGVVSHLADYSVDAPPAGLKAASFLKKFLGANNDPTHVSLETWVSSSADFHSGSDYILQMDIEGAEYEVLLSCPDSLLERFRILLVEFHNIETWSQRDYLTIVEATFKKLSSIYHIVHSHPNNALGIVNMNGFHAPRLLELTFLRKNRSDSLGFVSELPHPLDGTNVPQVPDIEMPPEWR
jgi:hypothetical protein